MSGLITSFSYSRLNDYADPAFGCPRKAKYKHVDRLPTPGSPAMMRGNAIHRMAELYITKKRITFPAVQEAFRRDAGTYTRDLYDEHLSDWKDKIFPVFEEHFDDLRRVGGQAESQWAFTKGWESTCSWFDRNAWARLVVDWWEEFDDGTASVIDFKTGKLNDGHREQLELYAIGTFTLCPDVEEVTGELWYLDQGEIVEETFKRAALQPLIKRWDKKTKALLTDRVFEPRPGFHCRYCPFSKEKGGPCEF